MRVSLVLTHQCNLACSYCYAGEKFRRAMSLDTALESVRLAYSGPGEAQVSFFGGEPMLEFPTMARVVRAAHKGAQRTGKSCKFSVTTNATILTERHLRFFKHYGFWVALSVDGLSEVQDRYRPFVDGRGSSELVWKNLETAVEALPEDRLHLLMVVSPGSLSGLSAALERIYRLGYSRVSLLPELEAPWAEHHDQLQQTYTELARIAFLSQQTSEPLWLSPFMEQFQAPAAPCRDAVSCGFGRTSVAVSPAGRLYPCARLVGTDTRSDVRIGELNGGGLCSDKVEALRSQAGEALSGCGGCLCVPLMPGDQTIQLDNHRRFAEVTRVACEVARQALEEVAA